MSLWEQALTRFEVLWGEATRIWADGGWAMYGLALVGVVMFGMGVHIYVQLRVRNLRSVPESTWRRWITNPGARSGRMGDLLDFVTSGRTLAETTTLFEQLHTTETDPVERDLRAMKVCVSVAPLLGLLGTVTGMLATFAALASGSGGSETMGMVAEGISEALITTETGLVIALPGLFFLYQLTRGFERHKAHLAHVETVCTQALHARRSEQPTHDVRDVAIDRIREVLSGAAS